MSEKALAIFDECVDVLTADQTEAVKRHERIMELARSYNDLKMELAKRLYECLVNKDYRKPSHGGYASFEEYVEKGVRISRRSASRLTAVWDWYGVQQGANSRLIEGVRKVGWYKASILAGVIDQKNMDTWLRIAADKPQDELRKFVGVIKAGNLKQDIAAISEMAERAQVPCDQSERTMPVEEESVSALSKDLPGTVMPVENRDVVASPVIKPGGMMPIDEPRGLGRLVRQVKGMVEKPRAKVFKAGVKQEELDPRVTWEGSVHRMLLTGLRQIRTREASPGEWLSPSLMSKFCPRAWVMAYRMGVPLIDEIGIDNRWYMDGGNALHKMFQEEWLGPLGVIKGGWECQRCLHRVGFDPLDLTKVHTHGEDFIEKVTVRSAVTMPKACPRCGMRPGWKSGWRYIEPLLYDPEILVCGWTDGILRTHDEEDEVWDLKTKASNTSFKYVEKAPNEEDVIQLSWYLDMAGLRRGRIVYLDRTAKKLSEAIAEHTFTLDTEMMAREKEKIRVFRQAIQDPESSLPACPNGGYRKYGPCDCRGLQDAWKSHRDRPVVVERGAGGPDR